MSFLTSHKSKKLCCLEELHSQKGDFIDMVAPVDYYWSIDKDERYNPYAVPEHLTLGQLTDACRRLNSLRWET